MKVFVIDISPIDNSPYIIGKTLDAAINKVVSILGDSDIEFIQGWDKYDISSSADDWDVANNCSCFERDIDPKRFGDSDVFLSDSDEFECMVDEDNGVYARLLGDAWEWHLDTCKQEYLEEINNK